MASVTEQFAKNLSFSTFAKADDLKKRILFTLGALLVYRFGTYVRLPGIDFDQYAATFAQAQGTVVGLFNVFAGGAVERMSIFVLNIIPYITASIIMQLMTSSIASLEALKKEGESGRQKINQYTRYLTVVLCAAQAYGIALGLEASQGVVTDPGLFFRFSTVITIVGGTMFLLWLGEQITSRGIGNGVSLIIFAGIIAGLPGAIAQALEQSRVGGLSTVALLGYFAGAIVMVAVIVFFERAQRRLLIQYPKRQVGNQMMQGDHSHLPLKLNTAGVIPVIFATSLLLLPATLQNFANSGAAPDWLQTLLVLLGRGQPTYIVVLSLLIIFFAFLYTAIVFNPTETAENLKKSGGFIPGIRPGEKTAAHIDFVLTRITVVGAGYLTFVAILPEFFNVNLGISAFLGGTSLLIIVSVTLDTVSQVQGHLLAHQYQTLTSQRRNRGRRRGRAKR